MHRFSFLFVLAIILSFTVKAQKTHKLTDLFIQAIEGDSAVSSGYKDTISTEGLMDLFGTGLYEILSEKNYPTDSAGRIIVKNSIKLRGHLISEAPGDFYALNNFNFKKWVEIRISTESENLALGIDNCNFDERLMSGLKVSSNKANTSISIINSTFRDVLMLDYDRVTVKKNEFSDNPDKISNFFFYEDSIMYNVFRDDFLLDSIHFLVEKWGRDVLQFVAKIDINASSSINFSENNVEEEFSELTFTGKLNELTMANNKIRGVINLSDLVLSERITLNENELVGYLDISSTVMPEVYRKIRWTNDSDFALAVYTNVTIKTLRKPKFINPESLPVETKGDTLLFDKEIYFLGRTSEEVKNSLIYDLKASYQKLAEIYKENADQQAANWAYASMMDLEGKRLKEVYKADKNFTTFFRWQLNNLMKVYTNHGTDPALAITISMYVIMFFAVIYFFFPSEWDVTSKSKLLSNFKTFREKNEAGYVMPFLSMLAGLIISLINALTLSLNAFTTLGFGNIPTKGFARYLTIIQGFVGWFLLGLFSVSLINQVLA